MGIHEPRSGALGGVEDVGDAAVGQEGGGGGGGLVAEVDSRVDQVGVHAGEGRAVRTTPLRQLALPGQHYGYPCRGT